jgi:hypothetical protein
MKPEKFHLRDNDSVCAGAFQLLRGRAPAQLRGNTVSLHNRRPHYKIYIINLRELPSINDHKRYLTSVVVNLN